MPISDLIWLCLFLALVSLTILAVYIGQTRIRVDNKRPSSAPVFVVTQYDASTMS